MSLFLHFKVKITVFTYTVVHPCTPIHLYTCTPIDLYTYTFICTCTPKHLCTITVAHPCTLTNLYTYPNVQPYILYTSKSIYFVHLYTHTPMHCTPKHLYTCTDIHIIVHLNTCTPLYTIICVHLCTHTPIYLTSITFAFLIFTIISDQ